jgi:exopolysaccharide biosynthesis WecB/TagA/CpsF family protein
MFALSASSPRGHEPPPPDAAPRAAPERTLPRVAFLGLQFDPLDLAGTLAAVVARPAEARFGYLTTANVDHVVRLSREPELKSLYEGAWRNVCDSRILARLARMDGLNLPASPGADLIAALFTAHVRPDTPVAVVGASAGIVEALRQRYGLINLRWLDPPMGLRRNPEAIAALAADIAAHPARFVLLCVGSPQQEMVAAAVVARGDGTGLGLCCGASLEFLTGAKARAPGWMRGLGIEWLHRLLSEPRRLWRRYLVEGPQIFVLWWRSRKSH